MVDGDRLLGGYDPNAGRSAHVASRPQLIPVPSLLRALLSEHLDPGYAAAAARRSDAAAPPGGRDRALGWLWQALAALLIATVFAAAVAQARSVAPGVRTASNCWCAPCGPPSRTPPSSLSGAASCRAGSTTSSASR